MSIISNLIKKKELTPKEEQEREYRKKLKKLKMKAIKNPFKIIDVIEETLTLTDEMVEKGIITKKQQEKQIETYAKDLNKVSKIKDKLTLRKNK